MPENYVLLERIELGASSASSIDFFNIPQTGYTDLKIVMSVRDTQASTALEAFLRFNNNTGSVYTYNRLVGDGSSLVTAGGSDTKLFIGHYPGSTATANSFSNIEIYIPNYTSSVAKLVSIDTVQETNATTAYMDFTAGITSDTSAINRITLLPNSTAFAQYSTISLYGLSALGTIPIAPKANGGDKFHSDGTYWYHTFTSSGTFQANEALTCDYLVVAGGGASGQQYAGGGGGGGYRTSIGGSALSVAAGSYPITVGAGGAVAAPSSKGGNGSDSVFSTITSTGGGGGSGHNAGVGNSGGSGGGGALQGAGTGSGGAGGTGNTPSTSPSQGNNGGTGFDNYGTGGGGGGASGAGSNGSGDNGGAGGAGSNSASALATATSTGVSGYYAGGGGGCGYNANSTGGAGGGGGNATAGIVNTGGGGGGTGQTGPSTAGGSGIVIIRYAV